MTRHSVRAWGMAGVVLVALLGGFVVALLGSQHRSRNEIRERFHERAHLSAALTESVLESGYATAQQEYAKRFDGAHVSRAALDAWARRSRSPGVLLLGGDGRILATSTRPPAVVVGDVANRPPYIDRVLRGAHYALSDVLGAASGSPAVLFAQPFEVPSGRRVLVTVMRPATLYAFFADYLREVPNRNGRSYVLDANGVVVGSRTKNVPTGRPIQEPGLLAALAAGTSGTIGARYFTSAQVHGTGWRVVLTSPNRVLFAPVAGSQLWLPWVIVAAFLLAGIAALVGLSRSRRSALALRRSEERLSLVVRGANDGIWDIVLPDGELHLSPRMKEMLGLPADAPVDEDRWRGRVHPEDLPRVDEAVASLRRRDVPAIDLEYRMRHEDGQYRWVRVRAAANFDEHGEPVRMAGSMADITDRVAAQEKLREDALHDSLTGLANRALFLDRLSVALEKAHRDRARRCAVLFLDLDRFKLINDSFTHAVGDELLVELGRRLGDVLRPGDTVARGEPDETVARLGGDEFTILLDDIRSPDAPMHVAERILHALEPPFEVGGRSIPVTASIGIAFSEPEATAAEMMRNADMAMYEAKRRGAPGAALYNADMHERVSSRLDLEMALRSAIEQGTMRVAFQPIVDLVTGRISGFEALSRWPAGLPPITPDQFIPVAEETGLIRPLGAAVLRRACAQMAQWRAAGIVEEDATVSVNIAACQVGDPARLVADIDAALAETGLPAELLRLEITESTMITEPERLRTMLDELRTRGIRAHIDDFGTGYSSLRFLQHFPGDTLKVDRSFVGSMLVDEGHHEIVRAIVALAHDLGLGTIAEGIDDAGQVAQLRAIGCELGQGFLFSPPLTADEVPALLRDWDPSVVRALTPSPATPATAS